MALKTKKKTTPRVEKMKQQLANPSSLKAMNLMLDGDLLREFKVKTIRDGTTMTEVLTGMIVEYVDES